MKTITMDYEEYKQELRLAENRGFRELKNKMINVLEFYFSDAKTEAFNSLWELCDEDDDALRYFVKYLRLETQYEKAVRELNS